MDLCSISILLLTINSKKKCVKKTCTLCETIILHNFCTFSEHFV